MNKKMILLMSLPALIVLVTMSFAAYNTSYELGKNWGFSEGYNLGIKSFPRLEADNVTFTMENGTISFSQLTITGEQQVIDTIKNLPSWSIINIQHDKPDWTFEQPYATGYNETSPSDNRTQP